MNVAANSPLYAYVGSRTTRERNARGEGITVYRVDEGTGALTHVQTVSGLTNPSYLTLNAAGTILYTVHGDGHEVSALNVDQTTGQLSLRQTQDCGGRNLVHLALDPTERFLLVADHLGKQGGSVLVIPVNEDGSMGATAQQVSLPGEAGPHRKEQPFSKPHFTPFAPGGRFVVVPDKGLDRVFVFEFKAGLLEPAATPWLETRETAGPRHLTFHPTLPRAYVVNELDSTVLTCSFDGDTGEMKGLQVLSALSETFVGNSRAAGIQISCDGAYVWASNRGADTIAVFGVDGQDGTLTWLGEFATEGRTPRFFTPSPDGRVMFVLNEDSDTIASFVMSNNGKPRTSLGSKVVSCGSPVCMVFSPRR